MNYDLIAEQDMILRSLRAFREQVLDLDTRYAIEHKQFGLAIGKFQGTSFRLAGMATDFLIRDTVA